jgi:hypothetical protein
MSIAAPIVLSAIDLGVVLIVFAMLLWAAVQDGRTPIDASGTPSASDTRHVGIDDKQAHSVVRRTGVEYATSPGLGSSR